MRHYTDRQVTPTKTGYLTYLSKGSARARGYFRVSRDSLDGQRKIARSVFFFSTRLEATD